MRKTLRLKMALLFFIIDILAVMLYNNACVYLKEVAKSRFNSYLSTAVYTVIAEDIDKQYFADIYDIKMSTDGRVSFIGTDAVAANYLSYEIALKTYDRLTEYVGKGVDVPVGAFTGIRFLSGFGERLNLKIIAVSNVKCMFSGAVESAGINQTRQTLTLDVKPQVSLIFGGAQEIICEGISVLCYDNLIVGEVPEMLFKTETVSIGQ